MAEPSDFGYYHRDLMALADWDNGYYHAVADSDGHITVYGTVDGKHLHISFNAPHSNRWDKEGENLHFTSEDGRDQWKQGY